jgi:hypothetical protein
VQWLVGAVLGFSDYNAFALAERVEERVARIIAQRKYVENVRTRLVSEITYMLHARKTAPVWDYRANEPAVPRPPAGIGAVLGRDSVLQEKMLLAPFLSTRELKNLSQPPRGCCPTATS